MIKLRKKAIIDIVVERLDVFVTLCVCVFAPCRAGGTLESSVSASESVYRLSSDYLNYSDGGSGDGDTS